LKQLLRDQQRGINIDLEKQTDAQFLASWLESVGRDVSPATYAGYSNTVRLHINPMLGKMLLSKLRPEHVQRLKHSKLDSIIERVPASRNALRDSLILSRAASRLGQFNSCRWCSAWP
jgi:hypothetical protein